MYGYWLKLSKQSVIEFKLIIDDYWVYAKNYSQDVFFEKDVALKFISMKDSSEFHILYFEPDGKSEVGRVPGGCELLGLEVVEIGDERYFYKIIN